jgi:hypothetical protein
MTGDRSADPNLHLLDSMLGRLRPVLANREVSGRGKTMYAVLREPLAGLALRECSAKVFERLARLCSIRYPPTPCHWTGHEAGRGWQLI